MTFTGTADEYCEFDADGEGSNEGFRGTWNMVYKITIDKDGKMTLASYFCTFVPQCRQRRCMLDMWLLAP